VTSVSIIIKGISRSAFTIAAGALPQLLIDITNIKIHWIHDFADSVMSSSDSNTCQLFMEVFLLKIAIRVVLTTLLEYLILK